MNKIIKLYRSVSIGLAVITILILLEANAIWKRVLEPEPTILAPAATCTVITLEPLTPSVTPELTILPSSIPTPSVELIHLGRFKLTAYCPCKKCSEGWGNKTATGVRAIEGRTIAVDPRVIPYGSVVVINGKEYVAEDCGGKIKGKKIDIYFESHSVAWKFGVQYADVYLKR
jgi:3D (Asp-Asp-Asp) domain-containing protein